MKNFKLIPAAFALVALASCSSDEFLDESKVAVAQDVKSYGNITIAPLEEDGAVTRQGNVPGSTIPVWQNGDVLRIYEATPTKYDKYAFNAATTYFEGCNASGASVLTTDATFALFPSENVDYAGYRDDKVVATVNIPQLIIYDEESEYENSDEMAYVSNIPMWGTVEGSYPQVDNIAMYYLTSALRLNIQNAFAKGATFVKIETSDGQPISGAFEAELNTENPSESKLQKGTTALQTHNTMYVDLRNAPSYLSNIYLPIVAGAYEWLKVSVTNADVTTATALMENSDQIISDLEKPAVVWTTIRTYYNSTPFTKGKFKVLSSQTQYDLSGVTTCEMLSKALKQYAGYDINNSAVEDLVLEIGGATGLEISREGDVDDYTIYVPEMNVKNVTIKIPAGISVDYSPAKLVVKDENIKNTFDGGKVTIIAGDGTTPAVNTEDLDFEINLPKTSLTLAGDFDDTKDLKNIDIKNVKDFSIGDGTVTTEISDDATIAVGAAESVTVAENATCNTKLDVTETKNIQKVVVKGTQKKDIEAYKADVYVLGSAATIWQYHSDATTYIGTDGVTDGLTNGKVYAIRTVGNVYIANKEESEAVTANINPLANNTITLKQGYVKKIQYWISGKFDDPSSPYYVKGLPSLTAADLLDKHITLKLDEICGDGLTAIAEIDQYLLKYTDGTKYYNFLEMTESKWGGKVIGDTYKATYAVANSSKEYKVYTASELASAYNLTAGDKIELYNNIDLNSNAWTCPSLKGSVDGQDPRATVANVHANRINGILQNEVKKVHVIKNLKLDNETAGTLTLNRKVNFGLFGRMGNSSDVKNIKIDGVTSNLKVVDGTPKTVPSNIGAVIGSTDAAVTLSIDNVVVNNASLGANLSNGVQPNITGVQNVGGLVGNVANNTTNVIIQKSEVTGTITGQGYLGGAIGKYSANIATNTVTIKTSNFDQNFSVAPQLTSTDYANFVYGTVGMMIGQVDCGTTAVAATVELFPVDGATDNITYNRANLGFKCNFVTETVGTAQIKYGFYGGNSLVGYSPNFVSDKLIVNEGLTTETKYNPEIQYCASKVVFDGLTASKKQNAYIQWGNWGE